MRIRVDCAYDGTDFSGWAAQPGLRTVQGELEAALATALRIPRCASTVRRADRRRRARARAGGAPRRRARRRSRPPPAARPIRRWRRWRAASTGSCRPTCAYAGCRRRPTGSTPASPRSGAATPTGSPTPRQLADPLVRGHVLTWPRAGPRRHERRLRAPARAPGLRRVLQAARGRHHRPHAARPRLGRATTAGWPSARCAPTPSATTWSARWWAA